MKTKIRIHGMFDVFDAFEVVLMCLMCLGEDDESLCKIYIELGRTYSLISSGLKTFCICFWCIWCFFLCVWCLFWCAWWLFWCVWCPFLFVFSGNDNSFLFLEKALNLGTKNSHGALLTITLANTYVKIHTQKHGYIIFSRASLAGRILMQKMKHENYVTGN